MKKNNLKKGFTLVEILIVIMIVGLLSTLAINGYSTYRKSAILDLTADEFVSYFSWAQDRSLYGTYGEEKMDNIKSFFEGNPPDLTLSTRAGTVLDSKKVLPKCYGLYIGKTSDDYSAGVFEQDFAGKKIFMHENWIYQGCPDIGNPDFQGIENSKVNILSDELSLDPGIVIKKMSYFSTTDSSGISVNSVIMRFSPPDALFESKVGESNLKSTYFEGERLEIEFGYVTKEADQDDRKVVFDLFNKKSYVEKIR